MANRENYPSSLFPLNGDLDAQAGATEVTVTGLQTFPVDPATPEPQQLLVFGSDGVWHPEDPVVSGTDAVGSTPSKPPVQVGGVDEGDLVRELRLDTTGGVQLAANTRDLLLNILLELRAIKAAILNLDSTANDQDYNADEFTAGVE